jgi:hypothetical protein
LHRLGRCYPRWKPPRWRRSVLMCVCMRYFACPSSLLSSSGARVSLPYCSSIAPVCVSSPPLSPGVHVPLPCCVSIVPNRVPLLFVSEPSTSSSAFGRLPVSRLSAGSSASSSANIGRRGTVALCYPLPLRRRSISRLSVCVFGPPWRCVPPLPVLLISSLSRSPSDALGVLLLWRCYSRARAWLRRLSRSPRCCTPVWPSYRRHLWLLLCLPLVPYPSVWQIPPYVRPLLSAVPPRGWPLLVRRLMSLDPFRT